MLSLKYYVLTFALLSSCKSNFFESKTSKLIEIPFNSDEWKSGNTYTKGAMINDLIKNPILNRLDKDSVLLILGKPFESDSANWSYKASKLDTGNTIDICCLILRIEFDCNNKVESFWVTD